MPNFSITVIVPVYNSERWVKDCIDSVLSQTCRPLEIIVVNDGSTDGSLRILESFGDRLVILTQPNSGAAVARNRAADIAKGNWLAFIDSDDVWDGDKLERQMAVLEMHPEAVGVYCNKRFIDASGKVIKESDACETYWPSGQAFLPLLISRTVNGFSPSQAIVKRVNYLDVGGFPEVQRHAEDWSLWLKLALTDPILYMVDPLVSYRRHPNSVSRDGNGDYGRLESRYRTLLEIEGVLERRLDARQELDLLQYELFQCSMALGYHSRLRGNKHQARVSYLTALQLRPLTWRAYLGMMRSMA